MTPGYRKRKLSFMKRTTAAATQAALALNAARTRKLIPARRSEIASNAARALWAKRKRQVSTAKPLNISTAEALGCNPVMHKEQPFEGGEIFVSYECGCEDLAHISNSNSFGRSIANYDKEWLEAGPLIEKYRLFVRCYYGDVWCASPGPGAPLPGGSDTCDGPTPLIAVCRLLIELGRDGKL